MVLPVNAAHAAESMVVNNHDNVCNINSLPTTSWASHIKYPNWFLLCIRYEMMSCLFISIQCGTVKIYQVLWCCRYHLSCVNVTVFPVLTVFWRYFPELVWIRILLVKKSPVVATPTNI